MLNAVGDELAQRLGAPKRTWVGAAHEYFRAAGPAEELAAQVANDVREDMIRAMAWDRAAREKRPNPFHPVWEIWQLGYKLETFDEEMVVPMPAGSHRGALVGRVAFARRLSPDEAFAAASTLCTFFERAVV